MNEQSPVAASSVKLVSDGKIVFNVIVIQCLSWQSNFFLKMDQPRPLFRLFSVFSNKQYKFYNNSM